jgi:predicted PurR-regulated permease PerM
MDNGALEQKINNVETNSKEWWKSVQKDIDEIKQQIHELPDEIVKRLDEKTDLKIQSQIQGLESRIYKWIAGLAIGMIIEFLLMLSQYIINNK